MKKTSCIAGAVVLPAAAGFALGFGYGPKLVGALMLLAAWAASAQPEGGPPPDQGHGPRSQQGDYRPPPPGARHRHPVPLIIKALDTNGDGIIDANEIANASAALLKLDKNGDGQLTRDEYLPPRPPRGEGPPPGDGPPDGPPPGDPPPDGDKPPGQ